LGHPRIKWQPLKSQIIAIFKIMSARLILFFLLTKFSFCLSQPNTAINVSEIEFDLVIGRENTSLINGPEYFIPFQGFNTHPFFGTLEARPEMLRIENQNYYNVPLLFDIYNEVVILRTKDKSNIFAMVRLNKEKVEFFSMNGHHFERMINPLFQRTEKQGFYDVLYRGSEVSLVCKRAKISILVDRQRKYKERNDFFIVRGHEWFELSSFRDFTMLNTSFRNEIYGFKKKQRIKSRRMKEHELIAISNFCNTLLAKGNE
jgi:hypothetical protein